MLVEGRFGGFGRLGGYHEMEEGTKEEARTADDGQGMLQFSP